MVKISVFLFVLISVMGCEMRGDEREKSMPPMGGCFIIGGGEKSDALLKKMIDEAGGERLNYVVVLPMAGEEPDSSFFYFKEDLEKVFSGKILNFNFADSTRNHTAMKDSLMNADLIYICGGDQSLFMSYADKFDLRTAIKKAKENGALVAGTSAGAAVMSRVMITGDQLKDSIYAPTYEVIEKNNAIYAEGLGLIDSVIVDQHFIIRSRYNRILSALCDHPKHAVVGIDEGTAFIVRGDSAYVFGDSQVVFIKSKNPCASFGEKWIHKDLNMSVIAQGDGIRLK
jgi:cyanophycinase